MANVIVTLDKDISEYTFNELNAAYEKIKKNPTDENFKNFEKQLNNATKVLYSPMEDKMNECIKEVGYDISKLTYLGDFSIKLQMNIETIKLWRLIQLSLEENFKYWNDKS